MKKLLMHFCLMVSMNLMASEADVYRIDLTDPQWEAGSGGYQLKVSGYSSHVKDHCFQGKFNDDVSWERAQARVGSTVDHIIQEVSTCGYNKGYSDACDKGLNGDQNLFKIICKRAVDSPLRYGSVGLVVAVLSVYVGCKLYSDIRARFSKQNKKS